MVALELLLLLACAEGPPPQGRVEGRTWYAPGTGLALDFPEGWSVVVDPALFVTGLPGAQLEGRHGDTLVALSVFHTPAQRWVPQASAMDLLAWRLPLGDTPQRSYQRLPDCHEAIEQVILGEDGRPLQRIAWVTRSGLAVLQAWSPEGEPALAVTRALVCEGARVRGEGS
ncbi:MAG: hypothetical protein H6741_16665 [Alphaproteobacteria bacterium]|nr:hypothetical protein [Alphaproteobacteria bacterium]MCB9794348.1 hypothetical protein [Alphaproteobacteria bacterium]